MSESCPCGEHRSYVEHMRTIGFISPTTAMVNLKDKTLSKDMDAYKRLRSEGLQPRSIDGCKELETKTHDRFEVERGRTYTPEERKRMQAGMRQAEDLRLGLT